MTWRIRNEVVTEQDIVDVLGPGPARAPIRVAVPFRAAEFPAERVALAMEELDLRGAWRRAWVHVHSPAVGYAFATHLASVELMSRGDVATVVVPWGDRSYYASIRRMADGKLTQRLLYEAIRDRVSALPADHRPRVIVTAGSAGSKASQDVLFDGKRSLLDEHCVHAAIYTGTPFHSRLVAHALRNGVPGTRRFRTLGELRRCSLANRSGFRARLLSHFDDWAQLTPLDVLAPTIIPAELQDESNVEPFFPLITFLWQLQDLKNVDRKIPGSFSALGHEYEPEIPWLFHDLFCELDDQAIARVVAYNRRATLARWGHPGEPAPPNRPGLEQVLANAPIRLSGKVGGPNLNGAFRVGHVDAEDAVGVSVVVKPATAQAHHEVFASQVADLLGIGHLVPQAAMRHDGSAAIRLAAGHEFLVSGVWSSGQLEIALRADGQRRAPFATVEEVEARARHERQLVQVFDYILGNPDRTLMNGLYDRATGAVTLIDHGDIGRGETDDPIRPGMLSAFQPAPIGTHIAIDEDVRKTVAERLNAEAVCSLHAALQREAIKLPPGPSYWLERVQSNEYRERVLARIEHLCAQGWYEYNRVPPVPSHIPGIFALTRRQSVSMQTRCAIHAFSRRIGRVTTLDDTSPATSRMRSDMYGAS